MSSVLLLLQVKLNARARLLVCTDQIISTHCINKQNEPLREKNNNLGFRPGPTQTTLCTRDTINYLTSETDTTRRAAWRKMESGELTIILILQAFMRGSLGQELAEK